MSVVENRTGRAPVGPILVMGWLVLIISGCALIKPLPDKVGLEDRLAALPRENLPLDKPVRIRWDDHLIPFIEAQTDSDLAFALGLVHAHLRLAQMELYRRASQGRLAEAFGPYFTKVDHSLRILGLGLAVPEMEKRLPPSSRLWLARYVEGINTYLERTQKLPPEFDLMGLRPRPWTIADVLTLGRLFGADVNWLSYAGLLQARGEPDWDRVWAAHLRAGESSIPSFDSKESLVSALLAGLSKSGSNSLAVAPLKTATGSAILANDPHLGVTLPNIWLIAGYRSPSYHLVGLMVPGLPCVVLGRNPRLGWGGTNMRAASSDLYDISGMDGSRLTGEEETIAVRWWFDKKVRIRRSPLGPVITDAPLLKDYAGPPLALSWVGHRATDEVTAILAANRARNWEEFTAAWQTYGVSSQNILMADDKGNIGQLLAVALPGRTYASPPDLILDPNDPAQAWGELIPSTRLPHVLNPAQGFLVSANNKPVEHDPRVGFSFSSNDRIRRLTRLLSEAEKIDLALIRDLQRDVMWPSGLDLARTIREIAGPEQLRKTAPGAALLAWDGRMEAGSRGALAFELAAFQLSRIILDQDLSPGAAAYFRRSSDLLGFLDRELRGMKREKAVRVIVEAMDRAGEAFVKHRTWGAIHHLELSHLFGRIPLIGKRYRFGRYPVDGSLTTLMKTAHQLTDKPHTVFYGSQARHISDMSDPDENYFLLLGGQDGLLNSTRLTDMVPLWLKGEYVRVPLRPEGVRSCFPHQTDLQPGG